MSHEMLVKKCTCFTEQQSLKLLNLVTVIDLTLLGVYVHFSKCSGSNKAGFLLQRQCLLFVTLPSSHRDKHQNAKIVLKRLNQKHSSCYLII